MDYSHPASLIEKRHFLTQQLLERPYSTFIYLERAWCYEELGYPDLGTGDAYRALLLTDEISDDSGEYHEEALGTFCEDVKSRLGDGTILDFGTHLFIAQDEHVDTPYRIPAGSRETISHDYQDPLFLISLIDQQRLNCFALLSRLLSQTGCLRSAYDFMERGLAAAPAKDVEFIQRRREIIKNYNTILLEKDPNWNDWSWNPKTDLPEQGHARRELYPWNHHEPNRFSKENLSVLNRRIKEIAP
ncbi:MAG: hypothetical protein LQ352_004858, partial [Teloschistes flavicans]